MIVSESGGIKCLAFEWKAASQINREVLNRRMGKAYYPLEMILQSNGGGYVSTEVQIRGNCSNSKIKAAVIFRSQGPQIYDYNIRLNHTWAFSMNTNDSYLNDLELGVSPIPIMQYNFSGFFTVDNLLYQRDCPHTTLEDNLDNEVIYATRFLQEVSIWRDLVMYLMGVKQLEAQGMDF